MTVYTHTPTHTRVWVCVGVGARARALARARSLSLWKVSSRVIGTLEPFMAGVFADSPHILM